MSEAQRTLLRPLAWVLARSASAFNSVIADRLRRGEAPFDPAKVVLAGRTAVGLVEWPDGRWLVLPLSLPARGEIR